ncbi:MAG: hypothetical protein ACLVG5_03065 [Clostridium sp.]
MILWAAASFTTLSCKVECRRSHRRPPWTWYSATARLCYRIFKSDHDGDDRYLCGILVVYLIRRLSIDYAWLAAIVTGSVAELVVIFIGDFVFGVPAAPLEMVVGMLVSAALAALYNFFIFSVDYSRTEYVQFEDDDYYYYVKAVPKMTMSTTDVRVKKINTHRRSAREREPGGTRQP